MSKSDTADLADRVTDEDIALRDKNRQLTELVAMMGKVITNDWPYRDVARAVLDVLDPSEMPEDVQAACMTLIVYCRKQARRTVRGLERVMENKND